jgi:hypothetical protein
VSLAATGPFRRPKSSGHVDCGSFCPGATAAANASYTGGCRIAAGGSFRWRVR